MQRVGKIRQRASPSLEENYSRQNKIILFIVLSSFSSSRPVAQRHSLSSTPPTSRAACSFPLLLFLPPFFLRPATEKTIPLHCEWPIYARDLTTTGLDTKYTNPRRDRLITCVAEWSIWGVYDTQVSVLALDSGGMRVLSHASEPNLEHSTI
jgi:hypothetical protein